MFTTRNETALVSSSARKLPVKVRSDLTASREYYLGRSYWVLKEPLGTKFYRFQDEEYAILKMFDGYHSLDDIKKQFEKEFPPQKVTLEDIHHFIGQLHQSGLVVAATPNQGSELLKRRKKQFRKKVLQQMGNVLMIKFKGIDPDKILDFLMPFVHWFFRPLTVAFVFFFMLCALTLVLVNFDLFRSKLPEFYTFFSPVNLLFLSATLGATKVIHEFGHGLTAKSFGGECHEMGIMILVLSPCLFVNVSDSWLLPNKWHRIYIAAAGMYVECFLASVCTFIWWFTEPGLLNYLALNVMFVSSVSTIIFNANPLMRYDGYYILADYLEIPNLRQKATKVLSRICQKHLLGMEIQPDPFLPQRNQVLFALFSVSAFMYRWVIMCSILFFLYALFKMYDLKILGQMMTAMSLFSLFGMPMIQIGKFFWVPGRIYKVKKWRFYLSLSVVAALMAGLFLVPFPYWVIAPAVMELRPAESVQVYVPDIKGGCRLKQLSVQPHQFVRAGTVLGKLDNQQLTMDTIDARGRVRLLEAQLESLERMRKHRVDAALRIGPVQKSLEAAKELLKNKELDNAYLTLKAPMDGVVVSPPWKPYVAPPDDQLPAWYGSPLEPYNLEATFEPGTLFCSIGDPKFLEAALVVDQAKVGFLQPGQRVELKLHELPGKTYYGEVSEIEKQAVESLDVQLSTRAGGEVPTTTQKDGSEKPNRSAYRVRMLIDNPNLEIKVGMTGITKVHVAPQTLWMRVWLLFNETFNFKM